jgi:sugar O-acyltransferase (sialic acid O-acetyltransferase NeuD family)
MVFVVQEEYSLTLPREPNTALPPASTVITGVGGHAREILHIIHDTDNVSAILGFLSDDSQSVGDSVDPFIPDLKILGDDSWLARRHASKHVFYAIIAIGNPVIREAIYNRYRAYNTKIEFPVVASPAAKLGPNGTYSKGTVIAPGVVTTTNVTSGKQVHLNTGCIICHDVKVGDFSIVSPGAVVCGNVKIGKRCYIGAGAVIKDGISICNDVVIGAGAVVVSNITKKGVYVGGPAKFLRDGYL